MRLAAYLRRIGFEGEALQGSSPSTCRKRPAHGPPSAPGMKPCSART